ncbi:MAG: hypothetical protein KME13_26120 [Myxacorys californica WJT36-NPBG1]|jgi:hypothetical protein|nr:hypothetical protein [Myxacorys californica WJT36-NPBG1]
MRIQKRLELTQKIGTIALNEALRGWQPPVQGQLHCPFCQSAQIYQRAQRKNGMTHGCRDCDQQFSEELVQQCRCVRPGKFVKCLSCPQYQRIRELMKFNIDQLRHLSEETVDQIMAHPDFYQQHFSVQQFLPQVKLKHYAESLIANDVVPDTVQQPIPTGEMEQLSLLDELIDKSSF